MRLKEKTLIPLACCLALSASAQYQVRFDKTLYQITPGDRFQVQVLINPAPAAGLSSFGVLAGFPVANADVTDISAISVPAPLNFNGVRGSNAVKTAGSGFAGAKGTVDFAPSPAVPYRNALLATLTIQDLGIGGYTLNASAFNTLGPTEQLFVDGSGGVLDPQITFGSATVAYLTPQQPYAIFAGETAKKAKDKALFLKGRHVTVNGAIHSNSGIKVAGNSHSFQNGPVEYVTDILPKNNFGGKVTFENSSLVKSTNKPYPVSYSLTDFAPGGSAALAAQAAGKYFHLKAKDLDLNNYVQNGELREGLYYVEGDARLRKDCVRHGRVTIVATGEIELDSSDALFESYSQCLLAFSSRCGNNDSDSAIRLSGRNGRWQGIVFAPSGLVQISSRSGDADEWDDKSDEDDCGDSWGCQETTFLGALIGLSVRIDAKDLRLVGLDPNVCPRLVAPLQPIFRHGEVELCFCCSAGFSYCIEYSESLSPPNWKPWRTVQGNGGMMTLKPPHDVRQRFYRLRIQP